MTRVIAAILVLAMSVGAAELPDAPSASKSKKTFSYARVGDSSLEEMGVNPTPTASRSFSERHHKLIIWSIVGGLLATGLVIGLLKHSGSCPKTIWYDGVGYPYNGTYDDHHACPTEPPGLDDDGKP